MRSHDYNEQLTKYVISEAKDVFEDIDIEIDAVSYYLDRFPEKCNRMYRLFFQVTLSTGDKFIYFHDFDCSLLADSIIYPEDYEELGDTLISQFDKATDNLHDLYSDFNTIDL